MSLPVSTRLSFAASGTASGLILNGVAYFLLLYYSQVLGLDPALAGLAMMLSLMVDAVSDPLVGRWSDRLRHRYGRRHPFLFASIVPVPLCFYLLWTPPDTGQTGLFVWLLVFAVALRVSLTLHLVPFNALAPEISRDYDDRTRLMNYSYAASWFLGTAMTIAMYVWFLADAPGSPEGSGILRAEGYVEAGAVAAVGVLICLAYAAFATTRYIPDLAPPAARADGLSNTLREVRTTLSDQSFMSLVAAGICGAVASGTSTALWAYMQPYFWGFDSAETSGVLVAHMFATLFAFFVVPWLIRGREKRLLLIVLSIASVVVGTGPVFLMLLDLMPAKGDPLLYQIMVVVGAVEVALIVMTGVLTASMIADIVEHREVVTGRREEGLLFSVLSFIDKVARGAGVWTGGIMLALVQFPVGTDVTGVDPATVDRLGWVYGPGLAIFYVLAIVALRYYVIDRRQHAENLSRLAGAQPETEGAS